MAKAPAALLVFIFMLLIIQAVPEAAEVEDRMDKLVPVSVLVVVTEMLRAAATMVGVLGVIKLVPPIHMTITLLQAVEERFVSFGLATLVHSHQLVSAHLNFGVENESLY